MAIYDTYAELIVENILMDILHEGVSPTVSEITSRLDAFQLENDISNPLFKPASFSIAIRENASASKYNEANRLIQQDLSVLYKHLFKSSEKAIFNFERWKGEAQLIEHQLDELTERINSLLLISKDTAGYFNFFQDNFVDSSYADLALTSAYINTQKGIVSIGTSTSGVTRLDMQNLQDRDVEFTVLTRNGLKSTLKAQTSKPIYAFSDVNNFWQEYVYMSKMLPVSIELKINLGGEKEFSRIDVDLHMSNQNTPVQITPMYSLDNYNWQQLPTTSFTRSIIEKTSFQFSPITARYVKFIITKNAFDQASKDLFVYEFGVDEIAFYNEGFTTDVGSNFVSKPLAILDHEGKEEVFSRIVLEVCEDIPTGTSIDYYVVASNDPTVPEAFTSIDPLNRTTTTKPTILDFGDLSEIEITDIGISYDATAASGVFVNPGNSFTYVSAISGPTPTLIVNGESSNPRYVFANSNERILNYCLGSGVLVANGTLELWRNSANKTTAAKVRGVPRGWGFVDPYYSCTFHIDNSLGKEVDFGSQKVILDGAAVSGRTVLTEGPHNIKIYKDNFKDIDLTTVTDLATLKAADVLYPYNQRYLIEGITYPTWSLIEEKIYTGCDVVAEYLAKEVSIFDMLNNIPRTDYSRFALDKDAPDANRTFGGSPASPSNREATTVFVVKVDENNSDFVNEEFVLRFKSANTQYKYLRFKAVFKTTDTTITPFLDSYRIKISN